MRTIQNAASAQNPKPASLPKTKKADKEQTADSIVLNPQSGETLAQRLLLDLAKKYKNMQQNDKSFRYNFTNHGSGVAQQKSQQSQMI